MTKQEILDELKTYGINATLRARKSTLERLLQEARSAAKEEKQTYVVQDTVLFVLAVAMIAVITKAIVS